MPYFEYAGQYSKLVDLVEHAYFRANAHALKPMVKMHLEINTI